MIPVPAFILSSLPMPAGVGLVLLSLALLLYAGWATLRLRRLYAERASLTESVRAQCERVGDLEFEHKLLMRAHDTILLVLDAEARISLVNTEAARFFARQDIVGQSYRDVIQIPEVLEVVEEAVQTQEPLRRELCLHLDSVAYTEGEDRYYLVETKAIRDENHGHFTRVILHDYTEQERNEQVRKDFIANASHELRTPLTIINGYVDTLMDAEVRADDKMTLHFLTILQRHGERLNQILEEMLTISKLESGGAQLLDKQRFTVHECIESCIQHMGGLATASHVSLSVEIADPSLQMIGDRFYWGQIFFNLIENAIKQNAEQEVHITIGAQQCAESGKLSLWVADNGKGIPAEDLPYIFRRFYRVAKDHSQQEVKGTGLGLSIVKRAVEAHGAQIEWDSIPNQETRFTITVPAKAVVTQPS